MARKRNALLQWCIATFAITFCRFTSLLPLPFARACGRGLGLFGYTLIPRLKRIAMNNLDAAYNGELTPAEKHRIARGAAMSIGTVAAEFSRVPQLDATAVRALVTITGEENLDRSKGAFVISAHMGNWEWLAAVMTTHGYKSALIVRPLDNARLNKFIDTNRRSCGTTLIDKDHGATEVFRCLREGYLVGALVDQSPRESAVPVTFFGQPCWATIAPAMVAARAKVPIHLVTMLRDHTGHYTLNFSAPIHFTRGGDFRSTLLQTTQQCQDLLESEIRKHPEQWLWFHRRWKPRPRLEEEWAERTS